MLYDPSATDVLFASGKPPKDDVHELLAWAREKLGLNGNRSWRLLSAQRKFGKTLFELEEESPSGVRRLIGKRGRTERAETLHAALTQLWTEGFRPPARCTVTESVACLPERGFILQEKAPGLQALDLILHHPEQARAAAEDSAEWLAALHRAKVRAPAGLNDPSQVATWARELIVRLPDEAERIGRIEDALLRELAEPIRETVACHGDYHAMNLFIAGRERLTGIDLDKFSQREPEADVGYFLSQTASFGFFQTSSFEQTAAARRAFVERYEAERGCSIRIRRAGLYMAMAFLKNLHFELVLLETDKTQYVEPWLSGAWQAIIEENIHLTP
jgi:Ser/Thr protein kinase RdoA (MazF antagonist)